MPMQVQTQPFEVSDFSGGITDHILGGDPRRSAKLHNFLITVDKQLESRPGYQTGLGLSNDFQLPSGKQRVTNLFTVIEEQYLFGQSGRNLYWYDPLNSWTEAKGPTSNPAVQDGDLLNQTTVAEFQRQFYLASDGGNVAPYGVQPSKVFRDSTNVWVARTAGLPRLYAPPTFNNGSLLSACISLANALRTSMLAHFQDSTPGNVYNQATILSTAYNNPNLNSLHAFPDKYSLSYLQTTTFTAGVDAEIPSIIPSPAPAATNQTTLFTLVGALNNAFSHHVADPGGAWSGTPGQGFYHYWMVFACPQNSPYFNTQNIPRGPNLLPSNPGTPAVQPTDLDNSNALIQCAGMLNDLYQKYNWHRLAVYTHSPMNDPAVIDRYKPSVGKIGADANSNTNISLSSNIPLVTPDFTDLYNYVNNLKFSFNYHVNSASISGLGSFGYHKSEDIPWGGTFSTTGKTHHYQWYVTSNLCNLKDCTDLDSMYLLIFWLRVLYGGFHVNDANSTSFIRTTLTTVAGSPTVTAIVRTDTGTTLTPSIAGTGGYSIWIPGTVAPTGITFGDVNGPISSLVKSIPGAGQATMNRSANSGNTVVVGQYSDSLYHASWSIVGNDVNTSSVAQEQSGAFLTTAATNTATDTKEWLTLANEFFYCFATHLSGTSNNSAQSHVWNSTFLLPNFENQIATQTPYQFFLPTVSTVVYSFFWSNPYTVEPNGIKYLTVGNPTYTTNIDIATSYPVGYAIPSPNPDVFPSITNSITRGNQISNLPTLSNDGSSNYDTSNILLNIYRTVDGGTTWYKVTQVTNGTASYLDTTNDILSTASSDALNTNQTLYTTGGVVGFDQAPQSKFVHIFLGTAYYGGVFDSGQFFPNRIRQSVPNAPDSSPATFFLDLDDEITGLSSARSNVIGLCKNSVQRIAGQFNSQGQGQMSQEKISDGIGCLNAKSIVRTEIGIFYAGTDGFYYTDGFQVIKISLELDQTYASMTKTYNQQRSIVGAYDKINRRIWWNMKASDNDSDNSITFIYYMNFGARPSGVFTTAGNDGANGISYWRPSSMVFWNNSNIRGDERGYVFKAYSHTKTDPKVDTTVSASLWSQAYIPWEYRSLAIPFGGTFMRKWLTKIHVVGKNTGHAAIQINAVRDLNFDGDGIKALKPINYTDAIIWGNATCVWNDPIVGPKTIWNPPGKMDVWRRFPQTALRADFLQIQMVPASLAVYSSSQNFPAGANCTVDNVGKTATILTPAGYTAIVWPLDSVDYSIYFDTDLYVQGYAITAVSGATITFSDAANLSSLVTGAGTQWVIRGLKKGQRPTISSYLVHFAYFGDKNQKYPGQFSNSGPGNLGENPS